MIMAKARLPAKSLEGRQIKLLTASHNTQGELAPGAVGRVFLVEGGDVHVKWDVDGDMSILSWNDGDRWVIVSNEA
jgi:hypothetical protein